MATSVATEATKGEAAEGLSAETVGSPVPRLRSSLPRRHTRRPNDGVGLSLTHRGRGCTKQPSRRRLATPPRP